MHRVEVDLVRRVLTVDHGPSAGTEVAAAIRGLGMTPTDLAMWMAVFADVGTSLLVVANGLRLLRAPG